MTEAQCKLGVPGDIAQCGVSEDSDDARYVFAWGGHCYRIGLGTAATPNEYQSACKNFGGSLASLNCAEEHSYIQDKWNELWEGYNQDEYELIVGGITEGQGLDARWAWRNGDPFEYQPTHLPSLSLLQRQACMQMFGHLAVGMIYCDAKGPEYPFAPLPLGYVCEWEPK